jgi:hypothetical protein
VVELVDTPGLGPGGGNAMGVQVPPPAPGFSSYEILRAIHGTTSDDYFDVSVTIEI